MPLGKLVQLDPYYYILEGHIWVYVLQKDYVLRKEKKKRKTQKEI